MVCRLCLRSIPSESVIKLYYSLDSNVDEALEMVQLIIKYLDIEVAKDDIISTMICQDCNDHLEDFHKFREDVTEKQLTLKNEFLEVQLKEESNFDDGGFLNNDFEDKKDDVDDMGEKIIPDSKEMEQAIFESPIDLLKHEMEMDDDNDDQHISAPDVLEAADLKDNDDVDFSQDGNLSSDDDMPLIKLKKSKKKKTVKRIVSKASKSTTKPKEPKPKKEKKETKEKKEKQEKKEKKEKKKALSAQEFIATSMELKCDICEEQVTTWKELRQHFLLAHTRTPYVKCCDTIYEKQRPLVDHLQWHKNPDAFKCKLCNENFSNSRDLTSHISNKHPESADILEHYECEHCSKPFRSFKIYTNHLRSHNKDQDVECNICNKRYASMYQLRRHIDSFHKDLYFHICDMCGKRFKCKESFKRHYQQHLGIVEPAVQCSICQAWLKNQHSLRLHRFVHEEHLNTCDHCGKIFKTRHTLRRHVKYWHELERNLNCTYCDKVFRQQRNLEEHMATHTGAQLYTCPHCGKESRSKSNMYVHVKRAHPNEWWKSKVDRLNLDPNTTNPELQQYQQHSQDVLRMYANIANQ